ncbi:MAG: guanylate kinase [Gemmatimonadota bacterium]|nr:guanylate kinase [Gemmatimonadota bacterium]
MEKPFGIEALQDRLDRHPESFVVILSGPAGAGKTSIRQGLLDRDNTLRRCVTTTTRAKRHDETNGIDYHFVSEDEFRFGLEEGCFFEWAEVYGFLYGATFEAIARAIERRGVVLLVVDVQGTAAWKRLLNKRCVSVFVLPPSVKVLEQRLGGRMTEAVGALKRRLENARCELDKAVEFDYLVVNSDLDRAISDVQELIRVERRRPRRTPDLLAEFRRRSVP